MKHFFLILYLFLFVGVIAHAQQPFIQYHTSDLYKAASIDNIFIKSDNQNTLYVSNLEGVLKYDGIDWSMFSHPEKDLVLSIAPDSAGNVYIGTEADFGLFRKDSTNQYKYQSFRQQIPERYRDQEITLVRIFNNKIFFQNEAFILCYENNRFLIYDIPNDGLISLGKDLYLVRQNELLRYTGKKFERSDFNDKLKAINLYWLTPFDSNSFLILDQFQRFWTIDVRDGKLRPFATELKSYTGKYFFDSFKILDNDQIVISADKGIFILNKKGKILSINDYSVFSGDIVTPAKLNNDNQHNIWLSSNEALIQVTTGSPLTYYDKKNGLHDEITSLANAGTDLYVGTKDGIYYRENPNTFIKIGNETTWNLLRIGNKVYAANYNGVSELQGNKAVRIMNSDVGIGAICKLRGYQDRMLVTTGDGLLCLKKDTHGWSKYKIPGFDQIRFFLVEDAKGDVWSSHRQFGVTRLRLNKEKTEVTSVTEYDSRDGLPSNFNNRVYQLNNGDVVIGTVDGIYRYNEIKKRFEPDQKTRHALGENFCIYSLAENAEGDIYFWGAKPGHSETPGILRKQHTGDYELVTTPFKKIAIPIKDLRIDVRVPILPLDNDEVFIGSDMKLLRYSPYQKTFFNDPIFTRIKEVRAKDSTIYTENWHTYTPNLPFTSNNLQFKFICSFLEDADKTVYQHKLKGFENEWSEWSTSRETSYTNIPGGTYKFLVRSKNIYDTISEPAEFTFTIQFPWYQQWWAYVLYLVLLAVVIWTVIYYYTEQIRLQKKRLQRMVNEQTKDLIIKNQEILNKNEEISMQAESLENLNVTKDKIFSIISHDLRGPINQVQQMLNLLEYTYITEGDFKNVLPDLKESVRYTVSLTDNLLHWARNQMEGVQVKPVIFDIHEIMEENFRLFRPLASRKNITLVNTLENHYQVFADKDMIKLVIRNLVNNAIKFTEANGRVELGASIHNKFVTAYISDTGKGIPKEDVAKILNKETFTTSGTQGERGVGLGLSLCQEFIERNAGHLYIDSEPGKGSKFSFTIPVSTAHP